MAVANGVDLPLHSTAMSLRLRSIGLVLASSLFALQGAQATVYTLGDQDFVDSQVLINGAAEFEAAQIGEPAPLNLVIGSDYLDPVGSRFLNFTVTPGMYVAAMLTLVLFDIDSQSPGSQLLRFEVDGEDLLPGFDALLEAHGGAQAEVNVYSIELTGAALDALNDGSVSVRIRAGGSGLEAPPGLFGGITPGNGYGIDFVRLDARAQAVPEPTGLALALGGLGALALRRRRS